VVAPSRDTQTFRHIQLIWLSERTGIAIVVTSLGVAVQKTFEHAPEVGADDLTRLSNRLNAAFGGKTMREVASADVAEVVRRAQLSEDLSAELAGALGDAARGDGGPTVASSGAQHLLDQPEFQDLRKLRSILRII